MKARRYIPDACTEKTRASLLFTDAFVEDVKRKSIYNLTEAVEAYLTKQRLYTEFNYLGDMEN